MRWSHNGLVYDHAMPLLIIAALVWIAIHLGLAGTRLRDAVVQRIGEGPFRGVFSLLTIAALVFLVWRGMRRRALCCGLRPIGCVGCWFSPCYRRSACLSPRSAGRTPR